MKGLRGKMVLITNLEGFSFKRGGGGGGWQCFSSLNNYKSIDDLSITHNLLKLFTTCIWIVEGNNTNTKHQEIMLLRRSA